MRRLVALVLVLGGCTAQPCDPRADRNIFQVGNCVIGGGYQQRVDTLQVRLDQAEADQATARRDLDAARARRDGASAEAAELRVVLANERARTVRLEREIVAARESGRINRQRLGELEADLARVRQEQDALRGAAPGDSVRRRSEDLSRQRQAIEGSLGDMNRMLRRE